MGFFVKNVENVQGDERDVIVFSTTFGRDKHGGIPAQLRCPRPDGRRAPAERRRDASQREGRSRHIDADQRRVGLAASGRAPRQAARLPRRPTLEYAAKLQQRRARGPSQRAFGYLGAGSPGAP